MLDVSCRCGELARLARTSRHGGLFRKKSAAALEHKRERALARAVARARQFDTDRLGPARLCDAGHRAGRPAHAALLRPRERQTTLATRTVLPGEGTDARNQPAIFF